jgi:hypothetical protein
MAKRESIRKMLDKKRRHKIWYNHLNYQNKIKLNSFIYGLFNDADSSSDYTAMNDMMLNE